MSLPRTNFNSKLMSRILAEKFCQSLIVLILLPSTVVSNELSLMLVNLK